MLFRGGCIAKEKKTVYDNGMKFAAFTGWQILSSQGYKDSYEKHLENLGLKKKKTFSKKQLEIEARIASQKADAIIERGKNGKTGI